MPYYDFDSEEERRRREQEAIRDAYFQEWKRQNNSAKAPKVKAAKRKEMAAANIQPVMYGGNVNPNNDQLPAMTTAEMAARQQAKYMQQVAPAADAAAAMIQNAPVDQYMMKRFLPNISDKSLEQTFAEAAKIDPNAKPAEPVKPAIINPYTSALDQAALIRDQLIPKKEEPKTPRQSALQGVNVPDGGIQQPNYASKNPVIPQPSAQETYTPDEELQIADINVKTLPKKEQESLKSVAKKQQEAYTIPMFDASNIDNLDNYTVMLQKAEKEQEMVKERDEFQQRNNLTDQQMNNFLYYQQMLNDKEKNDKVRSDIRESLHTGSGARQAGNALALNALSIMNSPFRGVNAVAGNAAQRALGKDSRPAGFGIQTSGSPYDYQNFSQAVQEETGNRIAETGAGEVGRFLYNTGVSAAESAYNMALTGMAGSAIGGAVEGAEALKTAQKVLQNASLLPFGANAFASTYQEARQRGLDDRSAALTATVSGAAEIITEKVSLDSLWDMARGNKRFARNAIVNALAQAGIEGSEEVASDLINAIADRIINGDRSEYEQDVQSIMLQNGGDEADARRQATRNFIKDVGMSFLGGAISGGVMGTAATAVGTARNHAAAQRTFSENTDFQTVADHIDDNENNYQNKSAAESAKVAKQTAQKLADKQATGEKVTKQDINKLYREISDAQQTESETIDNDRSNSLNMHDVVSRPTDEYIEQRTIDRYNAPDTKLTAEDVTKRMAQAETASELVNIRKQAENSSNESVRQAAQDAYGINQSRVMSQGETQEAFDAAENTMTTREAFNAGLEDQNVRDFDSAESRMAYNEGRMISMQRASRASIDEDLSSINIGESKLNGKISGVGENAVALTNDGQVELSEISDKTVRQLYSNAASQNTEEAAQTYLDNYATGMPVARYNNAFDRYSVAGATGQDFNNLFNNETVATQWMNKDQLRAIYDYGQAEADQQKIADATRQNIAIAVRGTGRVIDNTNGFLKEQPSLNNLVGVMAKVTGKDYVINREASDRINGYFNRAMQTVVLNANNRDNLMNTLFHEGFGEVMKAHNVEGYERVQQAIMDYLAEDYIPFTANVKHYQKLYQNVEGTKSLYDASSEMINDAIAGLFSTEEGIRDFTQWADKKYSPEEKKTVLQNIADFFQSLIDSFKDLLANGRLSDASRRTAEMGQKRAAEIRQMILAEMDVATANAEGLEVKEGAESENSYSVADRNDEYNGGIRYSIDTTAEALNLTFEKEGNVTVLRDTDGRKITHMTPNMVRNTPLGGMINSGIKNGFISTQDAEKEYKFVSDLVNQMLQTQDLDMVFAVNSVIGFQQLPSGEREDWTKNPKKSKNAGYVSNSDPQYSSTVDFTTICVKSQAIIDVMSETMKRLERGLTEKEITQIVYKNTHEAGEPVPCPVCYVFSRWVGLGGLFDRMKDLQVKYADADVATIRKDMAALDKQIAEVQAELGGSKRTRGKAKDKLYESIKEELAPLEKVINAEKLGGKVLLSDEQRNRYNLLNKQMDLLNDWTWLEKVRLSTNYAPVPLNVLYDINAGTRFANEFPESWTYRTTRGPAMGKAATPYADEHIGQIVKGIASPSSMKNLGDLVKDPFLFSNKKGEKPTSIVGGQLTPAASRTITNAIKKARGQNLLNGQRMQSTSDFRFEYALDYLLALFELQSVGAKVQMYTKVPESVSFLASAGAEINLSMMPYENGYEVDENGNPVYDENGNLKLVFSKVTGMHPDDAFRLSSMYDNVQPIVVGTNNIFIRGLLADPRITFVIPYHASGSSEGRYVDMMRAVGESVKERQDYSAYQTDTVKKDATQAQKAAADLRQEIVTGKAKKLSSAEKAILADNPVLHQLYQRFYGVDMNGDPARIENKYLDPADRGANGYGTVDHNTLNTFLTAAQAKTIMPYEFWDKTLTIDRADENGKAFQDYCESLGLYPRFTGYTNKGAYDAEQDFSDVPGYWKMLPDRAMYNRDGTYHVQAAVNVSNMRMDYLDKAKTVEGIVQPSQENDRAKVEVIVQKSIEDINNGVRYSLTPVEPIQPSSEAWHSGTTFAEAKAMYPRLFDTSGETEATRNPTQIAGTVKTYRKVYDYLKKAGFNGSILDASSGLGDGTRVGRDEYGYDVDDIEPYPSNEYEKTLRYKDYSTLFNSYDFIINNAVMNVMCQDDRDALVKKLGEMLNPGGTAYINVRGISDVESSSGKQPINAENHEWYMSNRSYQKGFSFPELIAYLQDGLGDDFTIEKAYYTDENGKKKAFPGVSVFAHKSADAVLDSRYTPKENSVSPKDDDVRFSLNDVDFTSMDMFDPYIEDDPYHEGVGSILEEGAKALGSTEVDPAIVRKIARNARSKYGSSYDLKTFQDNLEKVFAYAQTTDGVDYNDLANLIREVAQPVIDEAAEKVGQEEYDKFMNALRGRTVSLTSTQKKEVANVFGTYGNFRSQMRGIKVQDGAIPLDNVWSEIVDASGNVLNLEESEGNQPLALYDAIETLQPKVKNNFDGDNREVAGDLAMEIIEQYFEAAGAKDAAQKMREQRKKYLKAVRDRYNEKLKNAKKEVRQGTAMRIKESIAVRKQRDQIDKLAKDLYKWGTEPTKEHHIMNSMIQPIMDFLGAIDFVTPEIRVAKDGTYYANVYDYETGKYPRITGSTVEEVRANVAEAIRGGKGSRANMKWSERMRGITELYDKVSKGEQFEHHDMDDLVHTLDRGLGEELNDLLKRNAGVLQVSNLNSDDLKTVKNVLRNIKHAVNVNNKAFTSQERMSDLASETMNSVNERSTRRERTKFGNKLFDFTVLDMATPKTYFKLANSEGVYKILRNALNKKIRNVKAASEFMENLMEGVADTKNWDEVKTYKTAMGETIQMTDKQVMSLYELSKRQQAMMHRPGGVTVTQIEVKKGLLKVQRNQTKPVHLTDADIANITNNLTDEQKRIADAMQQYMAVDCSNLGNEASRMMYGFDKFTDPNYFPIRTDRNSIGLKSGDISKLYNGIAEMGFTKAVKQNARNAIVIDDIFDVFTNHVSDMATYNAYAPAIADVLRWYNYRTTDTDADQNFDYTESVQAAVQTMLGDRGKKYFENVIRNLNEQEQSAYIAGPWEGFTSRYKVAAVGANARVVMQQPTAIVRARNVMKDKYLLAGLSAAGNLKDATAHMKESSDIAWWKSQGYYESDIGRSMKRILTGEETAIDKLQDASLALAGLADDLTWSVIYRGVELEQKDIFEKANKDINSDAYRKAVNDRFDEVIDATQVVDSTLHRSQYMRSADGLNKLQASFMAEPTKSYNMLLSSFMDAYRNSDGGALKAAASKTFFKAASTFVMTAVVNAAAQSLIDAIRTARKKDDEDYWERWADAFEENAGDNVNPLKLMPWVKDVADAIDSAIDTLNGEYTYSSSSGRMDIEAVTNFIQQAASTIQYLKGESKKTAYGIMYQDIRALSQLTGIPVYNIMRDVSAVYDSIRHKYDELPDLFETSETNAKSSAKKRVFKTIDEGGDFKKALKYAEEKGNNLENFASQITSYYKPIYTELMETDPEEAAKMEARLEAVYKYLQELNGKDYKPRVYKWVEKPEVEQIELTGGSESSGSRMGMVNMTNTESMDVPISNEPANIWGNAYVTRQPRSTSYYTTGTAEWEKEHHTNAARMIQEAFAHGYDRNEPYENDFRRNSEWHMKQINKRHYARKKTYGSGGGNAVAWKSPD